MSLNQRCGYLQIVLGLFIFFNLFFTRPASAIDPGKKDSLYIYSVDCNFIIAGSHDEALSGFAVPFKYKTPGADISLDSVRFHAVVEGADIKDTVINRENGTVTVFGIW